MRQAGKEHVPVAGFAGDAADAAQVFARRLVHLGGQTAREDVEGGPGPPRADAQLMDVLRIVVGFVQGQR
ncbi:MAG: hypothetical protein L0Y71_12785 [Gemmataceae bacterium]|nr:hypothetical protein [Gemmataceae bacterium]